jgi:hypothetical protein
MVAERALAQIVSTTAPIAHHALNVNNLFYWMRERNYVLSLPLPTLSAIIKSALQRKAEAPPGDL